VVAAGPAETPTPVIVGSCVAILLFAIIACVVYMIYRKTRLQKAANMSWRVNTADFRMRRPRLGTQVSSPERDNNDNPKRKLVRMVRRFNMF